MGNTSGKESRPRSSGGHSRPGSVRNASSPSATNDRSAAIYSSRGGRHSRPDLSFLGIGSSADRDVQTLEQRRETKAEREARRLEKERVAREKERERSMREEHVDGGFLVTLGTYTGPEDFNKAVVRQLMIERRLAPFWKGLNDHSESWVEHQLVAAVQGKPIPPADEIPDDLRNPPARTDANPSNINSLTVPITARTRSTGSDRSGSLSPQPTNSLPSPTSPLGGSPSSGPFFRNRAKTLAALATTGKSNPQGEMRPEELKLPEDPYVNGQRIEAFLYKDAIECPICFLYYPPYLNKTRCCDQPICSECFVQIKRPDPHLPEHHEPADPNAPQNELEENQLVSEPAACPFCVQPEFGVTYEPPPFRRGLVYANQSHTHPLASAPPAISSSTSLNTKVEGNRRRTTSLSATAPQVITTDRVRPDWAKKLSDARAHALRRAAAATALHNAAYVLGNAQASEGRGFGIGRRRRTMFGHDSPGSSGHGTPRGEGSHHSVLPFGGRHRDRDGSAEDILGGRRNSRGRARLEDLEELMMMEAIRLSLAAEEERKRKEEKEAEKQAKKEEKKKAKEAKKADKASRKSGFLGGSGSNLNLALSNEQSERTYEGKGKGVDRSGRPDNLPTSSSSKSDPQRHLEESRAQIQNQTHAQSSSTHPPQQSPDVNTGTPSAPLVDSSATSSPSLSPSIPSASSQQHQQLQSTQRSLLRQTSSASKGSSASSFTDDPTYGDADSLHHPGHRGGTGSYGTNPNASASSFERSPNASSVSFGTRLNGESSVTPSDQGTPGAEPMFNFRSLAEVIGDREEGEDKEEVCHIEELTVSSPAEPLSSGPSTPEEEDAGKGKERADAEAPVEGETSPAVPPVVVEDVEGDLKPLLKDAEEQEQEMLDESVATVRPEEGSEDDSNEELPPAGTSVVGAADGTSGVGGK